MVARHKGVNAKQIHEKLLAQLETNSDWDRLAIGGNTTDLFLL